MKRFLGTIFSGSVGVFLAAGSVLAGSPDLILRNGDIITLDGNHPSAQALAIKGERIVAVGTDAEITALGSAQTRTIDLAGRTVIPGLVDTHIHAIRGGQTYTFETYWYDQTTLGGALEKLGNAAKDRGPDEWVAVVGSWLPEQFEEKRAPTLDELNAAVPNRPAYVQYLYDYALVNARGIAALRLDGPGSLIPPGISVERDREGRATGRLFGGIGPFNVLFSKIAPSDPAAKKESLQTFFSELNQAGVTGFIDASAGPASSYEPLFALRDEGKLTLHAGYRISAHMPGNEAEWFRQVMSFRPSPHSDGMLHFLGLGESIVFGMNDGVQMGPGFVPTQDARDELLEVALFAAERRIPLEIHAYTDDTARAILDVFEEVNEAHPLHDLRWAIAHLNTGSVETLDRMKRLGLSFTVQMGPYFEAPAILEANGEDVAVMSPPTRQALDRGLVVAGGTDSTRIGVFGVWQAIEYKLTGRSLGAAVQKPSDQLLSREEALRLYTTNAAWIAFEEEERGTLTPGKLADLAVLDRPYMTAPIDEIGATKSELTLLGGKIVHNSGVLAASPGE